MPTNIRDPKTVVTPDAFEVHPRLLGTPLAGPWRRLAAMAADLAVIGLLSVALDSMALLIWGALGVFLVWMAFRGEGSGRQAAQVLLKVFAGCLGLVVVVVALAITIVVVNSGDDPGVPTDVRIDLAGESEGELDVEIDVDAAAEDAERPLEGPGAEVSVDETEPVDEARPRDRSPVADLDDADVLVEYGRVFAAAGEAGDGLEGARTSGRLDSLRRRAVEIVAADSLAALEERAEALVEDREDLEEELAETRSRLSEERGGFAGLLRDIWDQAGSLVGIWSLYFTLFLTLWEGQTAGKRLLGTRVVRLDGEPLGWWAAFERAGGYVAGFATGLLGFAQVLWDPNRQCIHDKIVGTVVVRAGAVPLEGAWREAHGHGPGDEEPAGARS